MRQQKRHESEMRMRFSDRPEIPRADVIRMFVDHSNGNAEAIEALLCEIELEFSFPIGLMRPDDRLEIVMAPVRGSNWWEDILLDLRVGDAHLALLEYISPQLKKKGIVMPNHRDHKESTLKTLGDLAMLWNPVS